MSWNQGFLDKSCLLVLNSWGSRNESTVIEERAIKFLYLGEESIETKFHWCVCRSGFHGIRSNLFHASGIALSRTFVLQRWVADWTLKWNGLDWGLNDLDQRTLGPEASGFLFRGSLQVASELQEHRISCKSEIFWDYLRLQSGNSACQSPWLQYPSEKLLCQCVRWANQQEDEREVCCNFVTLQSAS